MDDTSDRRGEPRIPLPCGQVSVIDCSDGSTLGFLANLSTQGLLVNGSQPCTEQASYEVELHWRDADSNAQRLPLGIYALWSSPGPGEANWTGFQIIDIAEADQSRLDALIRETEIS